MNETYRILVSGHLEGRWGDWLGGFSVRKLENCTTELIGPVIDQSALHGVLARIRDLGVPLLAVDRIDEARPLTSVTARCGGEELT